MSSAPFQATPDTNVILQVLMQPHYEDDRLLQAFASGVITPLATPATLAELRETAPRVLKTRGLAEAEINLRVDRYEALCRKTEDDALCQWPHFCRDQDDQVFLDLAYTESADFIVSNDDDLLDMANTPAPVIKRGEATRRAGERMRAAG